MVTSLGSGARFILETGSEIAVERVKVRYDIEVILKFLPETEAAEVLEFVLDQTLSGMPSRLASLKLFYPWDSILEVLTARQIKVEEISTCFAEEKKLVDLLKSADPKKLFIMNEGSPEAELSEAFFSEPAVQRLETFHAWEFVCQLTDETLSKMNASSIKMNTAPLISLAAVRRFLQPVVDGKMNERTLRWRPSFKFEETIFVKGLNASRVLGHPQLIWVGGIDSQYEIKWLHFHIVQKTLLAISSPVIDPGVKLLMSEQELIPAEIAGGYLRRLKKFRGLILTFSNPFLDPPLESDLLTLRGNGIGWYLFTIKTVDSLGSGQVLSTKNGTEIVIDNNDLIRNVTLKILPNATITEVLEFVLDRVLGSSPPRFEKLSTEASHPAQKVVVDFLITKGIKADSLSTRFVEEKKLLQYLKSTEAKTLNITTAARDAQLSDDFFKVPIVRNLEKLEAPNVTCLMADETLLKIKAFIFKSSLRMMPNATFAGYLRYLQSAVANREEAIRVSRHHFLVFLFAEHDEILDQMLAGNEQETHMMVEEQVEASGMVTEKDESFGSGELPVTVSNVNE